MTTASGKQKCKVVECISYSQLVELAKPIFEISKFDTNSKIGATNFQTLAICDGKAIVGHPSKEFNSFGKALPESSRQKFKICTVSHKDEGAAELTLNEQAIFLNDLKSFHTKDLIKDTCDIEDEQKIRKAIEQFEHMKKNYLKQPRKSKGFRCHNPFQLLKEKLIQIAYGRIEPIMPPLNYRPYTGVVKDISVSNGGTLVAILANNECIYFLNTTTRRLTGEPIFSKRHHKSRQIAFSPIKNTLVAVCGLNGLVVWEITDPSYFFTHPFSKGKSYGERYYERVREDGCFSCLQFSGTGRYLAAIKHCDMYGNGRNSIQIFDMFQSRELLLRQISDIEIDTDINQLPFYFSFSPLDNFLAVSYHPVNNVNHFKIFELTGMQRTEDWKFKVKEKSAIQNQKIRQTIWSQDEGFILIHFEGTNDLHLLIRSESKQVTSKRVKIFEDDRQDEERIRFTHGNYKKICLDFVTSFTSAIFEKTEFVYDLEADPFFIISDIQTSTGFLDKYIVISYSQKNHSENVLPKKKVCLFSLDFSLEFAIINFISSINSLNGTHPKCFKLSHLNFSAIPIQRGDTSLKRNMCLTYVDDTNNLLHRVLIEDNANVKGNFKSLNLS